MVRRLLAVAAGLLAALLVLWAVRSISARELATRRLELEGETRLFARLFATRIEGGLQKHLTALQQMANFYASSRKVSEKEFRSFAATTLRISPSCLNVAYVDPSFIVRRAYPAGDRRFLVGLDLRAHPLGYESILAARRTRGPVVSPPLLLVRGAPGFQLSVPIFANGVYAGALVGACRSNDYFESMSLPGMSQRYVHQVLNSGVPVFATAGFDASGEPYMEVSESFALGGAAWEVRVRPQPDLSLHRLQSGRAALWTIAWLLAAMSGILVAAGALWIGGMRASLKTHRVALLETRSRLDGTLDQLMQAGKLSALGQLVAGVAHEINNPLAGVVGYTQLLMQHRLPAGVRRRLETIAAEAQRMTVIVRNLLIFARRHAPEKTLLGLNGIVEKTLELKAYQFRVNQITIIKDLAPDLPITLLDFNQIQQVLINLLINAQQAIREAGRGGTIRLATRAVDDRIELRVTDDGPGIPAEIGERIFEPFFTTKKEDKGTGLGLSLCYGIMQEHGGTIRVESPSGEGATFILSFPVVRGPAGVTETRPRKDSTRIRPLRILVVDDEQSIQSVLVELLTDRGHRVDTASDVPEALRKINDDHHDLIITDMKMPQGSGKDVYRAAAEKSPALGRRVVFTSGNPSGDDTQRFFRENGVPFLAKPFTLEDVERAIAAALKN
jgi:signal transduction histidine kinase/ActR/RegA family two-component response regulator